MAKIEKKETESTDVLQAYDITTPDNFTLPEFLQTRTGMKTAEFSTIIRAGISDKEIRLLASIKNLKIRRAK
jgi:hypothetical protein